MYVLEKTCGVLVFIYCWLLYTTLRDLVRIRATFTKITEHPRVVTRYRRVHAGASHTSHTRHPTPNSTPTSCINAIFLKPLRPFRCSDGRVVGWILNAPTFLMQDSNGVLHVSMTSHRTLFVQNGSLRSPFIAHIRGNEKNQRGKTA